MYRLFLMLTVLARALAPDINNTDHLSSVTTCCPTTTSVATTTMTRVKQSDSRTRRPLQKQGKADSPMLNYIFDSYATSNKHFHDKFRPPSFENSVDSDDTILDADTGATIMFDCKVASLRDKMVAWLKVSDNDNLELLTLDLDTHTADSRYRVELAGDNWRLSLSDARVSDSGLYCCQVSTHPPLLRRVQLTVHPPELRMIKEAFLESGETLSLKCSVLHLHADQSSMRWYRGNNTESIDELRGGVLVDTDHITLTSQLQVAELTTDDAGNYTCVLETPLLMRATTRVHVLQGSSLAELQSGVKSTSVYSGLLLTSLALTLSSTLPWNKVAVSGAR